MASLSAGTPVSLVSKGLCARKPGSMAQSEMAQSPRIRCGRLDHPERSRSHLGPLLLGYYSDDGKLIYAGRVGTGMPDKVLADLRLDPYREQTRR